MINKTEKEASDSLYKSEVSTIDVYKTDFCKQFAISVWTV